MTMLHSSVGVSLRSKLDGLFLVQAGPDISGRAVTALGGVGGVVVTGVHSKGGRKSSSATAAKALRRSHPELFLMWDPAHYAQADATKSAPFVLPAPGLFGPGSLADALANQRAMGVSVALTPTGHILALDVDALHAVIEVANRERGDDIIVHLPLDEAWLVGGSYKYVVDAMRESRHPVAVSLASNQNPTNTSEAAEALQNLASESVVPLLLLRSDLTGLDFIARGGVCAAFGMSSSLRHGISSSKQGLKINIKDKRPSILRGPFLNYFRVKRMKDDYASVPTPVCFCAECLGSAMERFTSDKASIASAHRHNAFVALDLHSRLVSSGDRLVTWRGMVQEARGNYAAEALALGAPGFKEPAHLKTWAR